DLDGVVLAVLRRLGQVESDLLGVDVERGDELDITDVVVTERHVHETRDGPCRIGVLVVLDALDQRCGAVADADDGDAGRVGTHGFSWCCVGGGNDYYGAACFGGVWGVVGSIRPARSRSIRSVSQLISRSADSRPCRCSSAVYASARS